MRDWGSRHLADARVLLSLLSLTFVACQHFGPAACSGQVADLASEPRELHVRLELTRMGTTHRHEVVVRVEPGHITAIGLTPLRTPAFQLSQDGSGLSVENRIGRYLGYKPERVYDAIAHAFLARPPGPDDPPVSAVVTSGADGVLVVNDRCGYSARLVVIADERA